jgi:uncharacterized membrane protein YdjX (TVP38/TMEM64 family)
MSASETSAQRPRSLVRRLLPLVVIVALAVIAYLTVGKGMISLESLVQHRAAIDEFVTGHQVLAVVAYVALYATTVALSLR